VAAAQLSSNSALMRNSQAGPLKKPEVMTLMPTASRVLFLVLGVFLASAASSAGPQAAGQTKSAASAKDSQQSTPPGEASDDTDTQEIPDDELDTAAVTLDVSHSSPLIQKLYQATRETKEQPILDRLTEAKKLIADGADVKATDQYGRTALHWTIFGSSYNTKPKIIVSYEEVADQLIQHGVEINHEDIYNDTALDYLLYSPNFEIQTLLIENGATSGFLTAFFHFYNQENGDMPHTIAASVAPSRKADLAPGQTLSVRLNGPVYSEH
jgi:hypothetical protein